MTGRMRKQEELFRVTERYPVTLNTGLTEIQKNSHIVWRFRDPDRPIAEIKGGTATYHEGPDERFKDRLKLDETTGSLTIENTTYEHDGYYYLKIISDEEETKRFYVSVRTRSDVEDEVMSRRMREEETRRPVMKGKTVSLKTRVEIQKDDQILWTFGVEKSLIAQIKEGILTFIDERFRDILELEEKTGDLTVRDISPEHTGLYEVQIVSSRRTLYRRFNVVMDEFVTVTERYPVTLHTGLTEIQKNSHIVWRFRDHDCPIAEIKGGTATYHEGSDERFKNRLKLDKKTGSLTIENTTYEHDGDYNLQIISDEEETIFRVTVRTRSMAEAEGRCTAFERRGRHTVFDAEFVTVTEGDSVTLKTGLTEIQENRHIVWSLRDHDCTITEIKGGTRQTPTCHEGPDGRLKDRLMLDETTGDLTIRDIRAEDDGSYELKNIIRYFSGLTENIKTFCVSVRTRSMTGQRVNELTAVEMPLLNEDPDGVNEEETSSL